MAVLDSLPVEVTASIFQKCADFPQVVALASTCQTLHSVWLASSSSIIWEVGKGIRCFDLALMAVRATAIVLKACQAESPPPPFTSMYALSGVVQKPTLEELEEVLNMQHLVRCIEYMYFNSFEDCTTLFGGVMVPSEFRDYRRDDEDEGQAEDRMNRFYRAMYQLFIAGAVLYRPYTEPFWEAKNLSNTAFIRHCRVLRDLHDPASFTDSDTELCRKFPVYNYDVDDDTEVGEWRENEYEDIFGPFTSWLVEEAYSRHPPERTLELNRPEVAYQNPEQTKADRAVQDLMCLLVGYEHMITKFTNGDESYGFGRYLYKTDSPGPQARKVTVILFGVFRVEEITMPSNIEDTESGLLPINIHPSLKDTDQEHFDIPHILNHLDDASRNPHIDTSGGEHPYPPATFQLWFFALRRYLDLGFRHNAFWQWRECMWWEDVGGGRVFHDPSWAPVQPYEAGRVSWRDPPSDDDGNEDGDDEE
ncbi:hypothetical protein VTL71DRAFT_15754 [Oculimacula yallundae]|uniref:F-box domain-containing protein n=1 Tax=Oculimacula yallundae TaxID=86028 RepID=A0ABR4CEZ8_9HELO